MSRQIDLGDVQGDVLRGYGNAFVRTSYLAVRVGDAAAGRAWLRELAGRVTSGAPWREKPATTRNVALSAAGLRALGVPEAVVGTFSSEFRSGMAARAGVLADAGPSAPEHWDEGLRAGQVHVLVTVNAQDAEGQRAEVERLRGELPPGVTVAHEQHAELLDGAREHFGYADGFAQPAVEGISEDKARGGGVPTADGEWRALAPGEFVLGYEDEDSRVDPRRRLPSAPADPLGLNGTYMVWRKLRQDVALFRRTLREATRHGHEEEWLAAKLMGRWRNGTPLVTSPGAPDPAFDPRSPAANDFTYGDLDPDGRRCPLGSHIRRSNPREALGWDGRLTFRHRIIRRGMPYGPPLPPGVEEDDGVDRGLVFVCFNASISRQFEGVQVQWLNDGNIFGLAHDTDFVLGSTHGQGRMTIPGDPPYFLAPQGTFVTTRGGEYLFVPGLTALAAIADGVAG